MGTGMIANATNSLPIELPGGKVFSILIWALATAIFILLATATFLHWKYHRSRAKSHLTHPVMAYFYGAIPMAVLTISAGVLNFGETILGQSAAIRFSISLWLVGTILGLITTVLLPYLMITRKELRQGEVFAGWLMPVVPPMVSAATGANLIVHLASPNLREAMFWACFGFFGVSLLASVVIVQLLLTKLIKAGIGKPAMVPTLWIVLGPIGQSVTAITLLSGYAPLVPSMQGHTQTMTMLAEIFGVIMLSVALLWGGIISLITVRTIISGLPFTLTWWSFTFPVGTCVTGFSALATHFQLPGTTFLAVSIYLFLITAWVIVASRTFWASIITGELLTGKARVRNKVSMQQNPVAVG